METHRLKSVLLVPLVPLISMMQRHPRSQQNRQFARRAAHVARANREDRVSRPCGAEQFLDSLLHGAVKDDVLMPRRANRLRESVPRDAGERVLARGVNVHQDDHVSLVEGAAKFIPQVLGAGVPVRLEENEYPLEMADARGFERGANFDGMMAVI